MISKSVLNEIVTLCEIFAKGMDNGEITKKSYTTNFKETILTPFEDKNGKSPNLILQDELRMFYDSQLKKIDKKLLIKSFGFWGNNIYSYVWTCVYYNFGKESLPASYSPQLYILANKMGLKFGFCYGHQITENDNLVQKAKSKTGLSMILNLLQNDPELCFFNSSEQDITARPELLFGENERIIANSVNEIANNWSNKSLLIKEFVKERLPENIQAIILSTLVNLKDFYLSLLPKNEVPINRVNNSNLNQIPFIYKSFHRITKEANLFFSEKLTSRFAASLLTKPFVILTGLSGSGKTKLAQAFAMWICENETQYCIVPVGADWTNREPLLGYPNGLNQEEYILPESGALQLIKGSMDDSFKPYFLILDEMNLSHVERYFADFLSIMESGESICLYDGPVRKCGDRTVKKEIFWPKNLFVIGTVNIDETTYMFSPKVLDRANVIEFRVSAEDMDAYLKNPLKPDLAKLQTDGEKNKIGIGAGMASDFLKMAGDSYISDSAKDALNSFFPLLQPTGAEFGYRSAFEISRLVGVLESLSGQEETKKDQYTDIAVMQKLLPKLHGSRSRLVPVLVSLAKLCLVPDESIKLNEMKEQLFIKEYFEKELSLKVRYPISFEKILRMYRSAVTNGYASYAEA